MSLIGFQVITKMTLPISFLPTPLPKIHLQEPHMRFALLCKKAEVTVWGGRLCVVVQVLWAPPKAHSVGFTFLEGSQLFPAKQSQHCPVPAVGWARGPMTQQGAALKPKAATGHSSWTSWWGGHWGSLQLPCPGLAQGGPPSQEIAPFIT